MDAVDDLGDAIDATRNLLVPVRRWLWLKLAIILLFVGGTGSGFSSAPTAPTGDFDTGPEQPTDTGPGAEPVPEEAWLVLAGIVVVLVLLWAVFRVIAAIMEFAFLESLRAEDVRLRRYTNRNVGRGLRLFGFRVGLVLAALAVGATPLVAVVALDGSGGLFLAAALFGIVVYFAYAIAGRFTSEFVAPIMLLESRGVTSAWRRFWPTLGSNGLEYAVYLLLVWIVQLVVSIVVLIVTAIAAVVVAIPFVILAVVFAMFGEIGLLLAGITGFIGVVAVVLTALLVRVPVASYFKYYALLLLGDTNAELDLIPEQRAAIRTDGGDGAEVEDREDESDDDRLVGDDQTTAEGEPDSEDDWTTEYGWLDDEDDEDERIDDWEDAGWGDSEKQEDEDGDADDGNDADDDTNRGW
jgi:hypothetical protein